MPGQTGTHEGSGVPRLWGLVRRIRIVPAPALTGLGRMDTLTKKEQIATSKRMAVAPEGIDHAKTFRSQGQAASAAHQPGPAPPEQERPTPTPPARLDRRRWAMLINRIYHADPLRCARCGGSMKIIAFIEADQGDVIRKILEHCGLWEDPPSRSPPRAGLRPPARSVDARRRGRHQV